MTRVNDAWEADQMLNAYILDYLRKKQFNQSCEAFMHEANVSQDHVLINAPEGFLFEWWAVFWDIFNARNNKPSSSDARTYIEYQKYKQQVLAQPGLSTIPSNAFNLNTVSNMNNPTFNRMMINPDMVSNSNASNIVSMNSNGPLGSGIMGAMVGSPMMGGNNIMGGSNAAAPSQQQITQNIQMGQLSSPLQMGGNALNDFANKSNMGDQKIGTGGMLPPSSNQQNPTPSTPPIKQEPTDSMDIPEYKRNGDIQSMQQQQQQILSSQGSSMLPSHFVDPTTGQPQYRNYAIPQNMDGSFSSNQTVANMGVTRWYSSPGGMHIIPTTGAPLAYFQTDQGNINRTPNQSFSNSMKGALTDIPNAQSNDPGGATMTLQKGPMQDAAAFSASPTMKSQQQSPQQQQQKEQGMPGMSYFSSLVMPTTSFGNPNPSQIMKSWPSSVLSAQQLNQIQQNQMQQMTSHQIMLQNAQQHQLQQIQQQPQQAQQPQQPMQPQHVQNQGKPVNQQFTMSTPATVRGKQKEHPEIEQDAKNPNSRVIMQKMLTHPDQSAVTEPQPNKETYQSKIVLNQRPKSNRKRKGAAGATIEGGEVRTQQRTRMTREVQQQFLQQHQLLQQQHMANHKPQYFQVLEQQSPHQQPPSPLLSPSSPSQPIPQSPHLMPSTPQSPLTPASVTHSPAPQHISVSNNAVHDDTHKNGTHILEMRLPVDHNNNIVGQDDLLDVNEDNDINSLLFNAEEPILQDGTHDEPTPQQNDSGAINLKELATLNGHVSKVTCCDFSFDGRILASSGHDKKVFIWDVGSSQGGPRNVLEGHSFYVNDVRFARLSNTSLLASAGFDKTIRIWKAWELEQTDTCTITLPSGACSVDFYPMSADILSAVDQDGDLRFYSLTSNATCTNIIKKGATKIVRFQSHTGRLLATGYDTTVRLYDTGSQKNVRSFSGHNKQVHSISWNLNNSTLATGSEDSVIVWDINNTKAIKTFRSDGNKIHCCGFHPSMPNVVIVGTYQRMFLWDFENDKNLVVLAHEGIVSGLAFSFSSGLFASASHDMHIKLWK